MKRWKEASSRQQMTLLKVEKKDEEKQEALEKDEEEKQSYIT